MFSIVITTYNAADFIEETLTSIFSQSYTNWEIVLVDDGSTDDTVKIVTQIKSINPDLAIHLYTPQRLGRGKALNYAVSKANYDWIVIIDADDLWHPNKLAFQTAVIENQHVDLVCTTTTLFENSEFINFQELKPSSNIPIKNISLASLLLKTHISHSSVAIRKKLVYYDESRSGQYDLELWIRLLSLGTPVFLKIDTPLTFHRIHDNQSFEGSKKNFRYGLNSIKLRLFYSFKHRAIFPLFYNFAKVVYYMIPRKLRKLFLLKKM